MSLPLCIFVLHFFVWFSTNFLALTPFHENDIFQQIVPDFLNGLTDDELKKESNEAKNEAKNDALTGIIKALKYLTWRVPKHEETTKSLEMFRLKMILRYIPSIFISLYWPAIQHSRTSSKTPSSTNTTQD